MTSLLIMLIWASKLKITWVTQEIRCLHSVFARRRTCPGNRGGIINALPLLGSEVFLVVNGDIVTDFPFAELKNRSVDLAHLVLVKNPEHHAKGDFGLDNTGKVIESCPEKLTFSGIGLYRPELFDNTPAGSSKLGPLLRQAIASQRVTGQYYAGFWMDIGTPERLQELDYLLKTRTYHD